MPAKVSPIAPAVTVLTGRDYKPPKGTEEAHKEAIELSQKYAIDIISYLKDESLTKEELDKQRILLYYHKMGPKRGAHIVGRAGKLVSADVMYILSSKATSKVLAKVFGVTQETIKEIRSGTTTWQWEYRFIKRLKAMVRSKYREATNGVTHVTGFTKVFPRVFRLRHLTEEGTYEDIVYGRARRACNTYRRKILTNSERKLEVYNKMIEEGTLEVIYPIDEIPLI